MNRCKWVNLKNQKYIDYHDYEWGVVSHDDAYLFELLLLESFQAGLSWECVLNKRKSFKEAFDSFDYKKIAKYNDDKVNELMENDKIIKNKLKIKAAINNAKIFTEIQQEFGSFDKFVWSFSNNKIIKNKDDSFKPTSSLSDRVSKELKRRGMKFVGSTIIYSYLQAIGIIDDHETSCYKYQKSIE